MRAEPLIERICQRVWFAGPEQALRAVHATLEVLSRRLHPIDAEVVRARLPQELARSLKSGEDVEEFGRAELFRRVRDREGMRMSVSAEHVTVICQSIAEMVDDSARRHLTLRLPPEFADLFTPPRRRDPMAGAELHHYARRPTDVGRTLATGRQAYGCHASPHGQAGSVLESDNPHGDSKLSSGSFSVRPTT